MKTSTFKTNAKCSGCVDKIAEALDGIISRNQWNIDLSVPDKILVVTSDIPDEEIIRVIEKAGFRSEKIN